MRYKKKQYQSHIQLIFDGSGLLGRLFQYKETRKVMKNYDLYVIIFVHNLLSVLNLKQFVFKSRTFQTSSGEKFILGLH